MKLSTESYKGVRDFFPEDMRIQNYIFKVMHSVVEKFGYEEYGASILEPAELYKVKTGDEIVNEQTYTFTDRGLRSVTLRPEMTPTLARMIAQKRRDLSLPIRWYSIPNLFRYEKPQRGRLREHWQLNVDVFGIKNINAEIEIINIGYSVLKAFGMKDTDFEVRINNRKVMNYIMDEVLALPKEKSHAMAKLIDKKNKMSGAEFIKGIDELTGPKASLARTILNSQNFEEFMTNLPHSAKTHEGIEEIRDVLSALESAGIGNARFDQSLMRGFDYYTGTVFEIFDKGGTNARSVLGGGRYDDLLSIFDSEKIPAVGFGAGDVVIKDLLETYNLLPKNVKNLDAYVAILDKEATLYANDVAGQLRHKEFRIAVDYTERKIAQILTAASKKGATFVLVIGKNEMNTGTVSVRSVSDGKTFEVADTEILSIFKK